MAPEALQDAPRPPRPTCVKDGECCKGESVVQVMATASHLTNASSSKATEPHLTTTIPSFRQIQDPRKQHPALTYLSAIPWRMLYVMEIGENRWRFPSLSQILLPDRTVPIGKDSLELSLAANRFYSK